MMDLIIRGGSIAGSEGVFKGDLAVRDGKVHKLSAPGLPEKAHEEIDASGMIVMPGAIDVHTHFQLPIMDSSTADDFESGSMAAAAGGVTTFIDFVTQTRGHSLHRDLEARRKEADGNVYIDYALHMGITDFTEETLNEIPSVVDGGIPSFKVFMAYAEEGWMADDGKLLAVLDKTARSGGIMGIHGENPFLIDAVTAGLISQGKTDYRWHGDSRPAFTEAEAIRRAIYLTGIAGSRLYIFHLTARESAEAVAQARPHADIFAETCAQYLLLDDSMYRRGDGWLYPSCPPLRKEADREALWNALRRGTLQVVSTDHCSFTEEQKFACRGDFRKIPRGLPGCETLLPMLYSQGVAAGRISLPKMVELLCLNPARIFGLYPAKGHLGIGADADITIIDPAKTTTVSAGSLHMKAGYTPYEGMTASGWPVITVSRGEVIFRDGRFTAGKGRGYFVKRRPFSLSAGGRQESLCYGGYGR